MEFRLFGPVEADLDGRRLDLGPTRQRCLLAVLLIEANKPVTVHQLIDRIWSDRAPRQARVSLQSYVSRLRGIDLAIDRKSDGYALTVDERTVDLHRFRHLAIAARTSTDDDQALARLEQALRLSRAEPFAGMDTPWFDDVRATVTAERLSVVSDHNELMLRRGHHHELLTSLRTQAEQRPLDERLTGQFMVALYRSGRQADALNVYLDTKARLGRELGVGPGPELYEIYRRILVADPALADTAPGTRQVAARPVPCRLPAVSGQVMNRPIDVAALDAAVWDSDDTTVTIVAITGPAGIGTTWLALSWAHRHADRFPHGQLFADLRETDPASVLPGFLAALEVEPAAVPSDPDAQAGLFRSLTADRRLLVVLDNATDTAQITPLLPGGTSCVVLVTSRDPLTGLVAAHGAHPLPLVTG